MLPGSVESGVLLSPKFSVPPFCVDGLTTCVLAWLKATVAVVLPPDELPLLPQAARVSAATALTAARPAILRLFIG